MAIPRVSDPLALIRTLTVLGVLGLVLAAVLCVLWLGSLQPTPVPEPTASAVAVPRAPVQAAPPVPTRAPRRAPYPGSTGSGPTGTGVVTPTPTLAPGAQPL